MSGHPAGDGSILTQSVRSVKGEEIGAQERTREDVLRDLVRTLKEYGVSPRDIADEVDVSHDTVYKFARGETISAPKLDAIDRFCQGLWGQVAAERRCLADVLRWMADLLERGESFPPAAFQGRSEEGDDPILPNLSSALKGDRSADSGDSSSETGS